MSAAPPTRRRRRARRGSLDRPISGRTYRGTWLFVAFPLLLAAFTVARPAALPRPALPAAFDRVGATQLGVDLATHGGALGGVGAAHFAEHSPLARDVSAVIDLDAIAGHGPTALEFAGNRSRFPSGGLVATASERVLEQGGEPARRPSALRQLLDLAFPFSPYEQAPLLGKGISAVTLTSAGD